MTEKIFKVKIKTNTKNEEIVINDNQIIAKVNALPIEGRANDRLIELLASFLRCPKSKIEIIRGLKNRNKVVLVKD